MSMQIRPRRVDDVIVLDLAGRIDVNAAILVEIVGNCVHEGYKDILCNFEAVDFVDYMGVSVIVIAYKEVINNKGRMKFSNVPAQLKSIFSISGIDKAIEDFATEELAIKSFKEDQNIEHIQKLQLRRRFKRLPIDIKAELRSGYDKSAPAFKVDILNFSAVGAYVYGCDKFKLQDKVVLVLRLPSKHEELQLDALVVWLSDKQVQPQFHPGMGVEFRNLPGPVQKKLIAFIERNLSCISSE
ncbi:MAG: PilZ domain-containing protein [Candidatus Omnitrophica bacterium]|nr:PilZ domain-containing protein [Candidatus Omnitrophota bacterium]